MPFWPLLALESTATAGVEVEKVEPVEPVEPQEHDHKPREQPPAVVHLQTGASDTQDSSGIFLKKHLQPTCTSLEPTPLADIAQERPNDNQLPTTTRIRYHATSA